ncbi:MAG TPA: hypothetical protein VGR11_03355, partial [Solirubrobacteraceae bacterium]|nr:hypothetical protein [Solirubrobacteraceae bacterium]
MRKLFLRTAPASLFVAVFSALAGPAQAYDERPMRLPAMGGPGAGAASSQPSRWLVAAEAGGAARADA